MACIGSQKCPPSHYMSATSLRPRDATPVLRRLAHAPPPVFSTGGDSHAHLLQRPSCRLVARMMTVSEDMYDNSPSRHAVATGKNRPVLHEAHRDGVARPHRLRPALYDLVAPGSAARHAFRSPRERQPAQPGPGRPLGLRL